MEIDYNIEKGYIAINQNKYLETIKNRYNKNKLNPVSSPIELGVKLEPSQTQATTDEITLYQQQVGSLLYLALKTRPDIDYAVSRCSRYASNPNITHYRALDRI